MAKKILIIEENELNMKLFNDVLLLHQYETFQAKNEPVAMQLAHEQCPDLIVMDVQLSGASNLDVARRLKADPALCRVPLLAVTASALKGDEDRIRAGGCDGYLAKPISVRGFLRTVAQFLG